MRLIAFLLCIFFSNAIAGQNLTGKVTDVDNGDITNAVVSLINKQDSVLKAFVRVTADGKFTLKRPKEGTYIILISHPKFADYLDTLIIDQVFTNVGDIKLQSKRKVLEEVIVRAKVAAIKMKGDTTIYTADSFAVKEGGTVEDLFKKLPGFTVGRNGEITAQGKKVQNLLVDGEEFFGNDPGMVSKTLSASAIDKVELFDKKSDQATFTGIDDGERQTTVNLKLKANAKKGVMGKAVASGGTPENYDTQAMLQAFKGKRKFALFGMSGNVGNTDLGWEERESYGGSEGTVTEMDGDNMYSWYQGDEFSSFSGGRNGIPQNWNLGAHYSNKFNSDKQTLNLSYRFNKVNSEGESRTFSQTFLPDSTWNNNSGTNSFQSTQRNKLSANFETKIDSANTVKLTVGFSEKDGTSLNNSFQDAFSGATNINGNKRTNTNQSVTKNYNASLLWMHKFKKLRRTLSLNTSLNNTEVDGEGNLFSENVFYKNGVLLRKDTVDQLKVTDNTSNTFSSRLVYTEPLTKTITAELSYAFNNSLSDKNQNSFDKDISGKYGTLAPLFSNNFLFKTAVHAPRIGFNYTKKKTSVNIGSRFAFNSFDQTDRTTNVQRLYNFTNFFPTASVRFGLPKNVNISLGYNGDGRAPSLDQLQPLLDNTNPFFIRTGNPDLVQSFSHRINGNVSKWDMLTQSSLWSYFSFSTVQNAFTNFSELDSLGRTVSKTVNVNGNKNGNFGVYYNSKIKKLGINFNFGPTGSFSRYISFVNGLRNVSNNYNIGSEIGFNDSKNSKDEENLWSWDMSIRPSINVNKSSVNTTANAQFWMFSSRLSGNLRLAKGLFLNSDVNIEQRQKDTRFPQNNNYALWNAALEKTIIKNKWLASISVQDILNQNRGFDRNFNGYNFTESFYNVLRRYYLVTVTYKFNTHKAKSK